MQMTYIEAAQLELFQALKSIKSESELNDFKLALSRFFADRAQKEIDALWDDGKLNQEKLDELRSQTHSL